MSKTAIRRVLHLEDSRFDHELATFALKSSDFQYELSRVETLESFVEHVQTQALDAIVADYRLPGFTAIDAWNALHIQPKGLTMNPPPFIILSGAIGESAAVDAVKQGISDYLLKDDITKLDHVISRAIEVHDCSKVRSGLDCAQFERPRQPGPCTLCERNAPARHRRKPAHSA